MPEQAFTVETIELDLPAVTTAFGRRLHEAGVPVTAERAAAFARALTLVRPISRRRLYWTARAVLVSDQSQVKPFDSVFLAVSVGGAAGGRAGRTHVRRVPRRRRLRRSRRRSRRRCGAARLASRHGAVTRPRRTELARGRAPDGGQRRGAAARQALRRARARRARRAVPGDEPAAGRDAAAPHPTGAPRPSRRAHRHAPHAAPEHAHRRRSDPPGTPRADGSCAGGS